MAVKSPMVRVTIMGMVRYESLSLQQSAPILSNNYHWLYMWLPWLVIYYLCTPWHCTVHTVYSNTTDKHVCIYSPFVKTFIICPIFETWFYFETSSARRATLEDTSVASLHLASWKLELARFSILYIKTGSQYKLQVRLTAGWVGGWSSDYSTTSWLHLASWNLPDSQPSWESKMEPECGKKTYTGRG